MSACQRTTKHLACRLAHYYTVNQEHKNSLDDEGAVLTHLECDMAVAHEQQARNETLLQSLSPPIPSSHLSSPLLPSHFTLLPSAHLLLSPPPLTSTPLLSPPLTPSSLRSELTVSELVPIAGAFGVILAFSGIPYLISAVLEWITDYLVWTVLAAYTGAEVRQAFSHFLCVSFSMLASHFSLRLMRCASLNASSVVFDPPDASS